MSSKQTNELTIDALTENLDDVLSFIGSYLSEADCPPKAEMQINISVEEIFVNIANYAYPEKTGKAVIRVDMSEDPRAITITFIDSGTKYDPLAKPDPDVTLSASERQIGGLGIFMTKKFMDEVSYEYRDEKNVFAMKKYL